MNTWIDVASAKLGVKLAQHVDGQAVGPCPHCGGRDRFIVFMEGNAWCRQCEDKRWWREDKPSKDEIERARETKRRHNLVLQASLHGSREWIRYHEQVEQAVGMWAESGIGKREILRWGLGYCESAPVLPGNASLTIPVFYRGRLVDIRHRIVGASDGGKYRSHKIGLTPSFFNLDSAGSGKMLYIVEGEKKAIVMDKHGFKPCIAYPGIGFSGIIAPVVERVLPEGRTVIFVPDPGTTSKVEDAASQLAQRGYKCYIVDTFDKPDDFIQDYGAEVLRQACAMRRRV